MEGLSIDNIYGEEALGTLFEDPQTPPSETGSEEEEKETKETEDNPEETTEAVDPNDLFGDDEEQPESVGSEKDKGKEKEDAVPDEGSDTSPDDNLYSSIANACAVDGIFPNLDEETINKANDAESFSELFDLEVNARLDEAQRRIKQALENGVEPDAIRQYEGTLKYINSITEASLAAEGAEGEELRRRIIYQDFLNRGYNPDKAQKYTERTIDAGTDIEDAKEALQSNKDYFQNEYNKLLQEAQREADNERAKRKKQADELKTSLMGDKQLLGEIELPNDVRKKAFEAISKPVYKDPSTGEYMTALQKYEAEHRPDFLKYVSLFYTLTNGFKDFDSFTKGEVKKKVKKGLRELEQTLNTTRRFPNGSLKPIVGRDDDPESFIGKGVRLDL